MHRACKAKSFFLNPMSNCQTIKRLLQMGHQIFQSRTVFFVRTFIIVQIFLWSFQSVAWAEEEHPTGAPVPPSSMEIQADPTRPTPIVEDYGSAFFKMLSALIVLLVVVVIIVWLLRSVSRGRFSRGASGRNIEIIERRSLSPKSTLYLVEIDGARVLLAESQLEVRPLYQGHIPERSTD